MIDAYARVSRILVYGVTYSSHGCVSNSSIASSVTPATACVSDRSENSVSER
jgi:hypothetical protein